MSDFSERVGRLHTALVCDILDSLDRRSAAMDYHVRPAAGPRRVVGRAFTFASFPVDEPEPVPYEMLLAGYAEMSPGDVVVLATNGELASGVWGELLSTAARARGAAGAVTDGLTRDVEAIERMGFPVFARGASPLDSAGRQAVRSFGEPIVCGGVAVRAGDIVFGDAMGVVVIPAELAEETVRLAEAKNAGEEEVRLELERGDDPASVFGRHGIL